MHVSLLSQLALLLHQQLNSSPRVPRVPRVRQATGMQLTSPTGTSMLSKRSSFSGGKDHVVVRFFSFLIKSFGIYWQH